MASIMGGGPQMFYNILRILRPNRVQELPTRVTMLMNYLGGNLICGQYGNFIVEGCTPLAKHDHSGPYLSLWGVAIRGRLHLSIDAASVSVEFATAFHDAVLRHLREAIKDSAPIAAPA